VVRMRAHERRSRGGDACSDTDLGSKRRAEKRYGSRQRARAWEPAERGRAEGRASDSAPPMARGWGLEDYTRTYMDMHRAKRSRCSRSACKLLQGLSILILFGNLRINYKREYATRIYRLGCYTN